MKPPKVQEIIEIAKQAGQAILEVYDQDHEVEFKEDNSPLTKADKAAHNIIVKALEQYNYPILSEEGKSIPYTTRKHWVTFWLVDPLDGTKEFVKKNGEFTVNIALIHNNTPVLGVIYAPVLNKTYYTDGKRAYKEEDEQTTELPGPKPEKYTIVASRSHLNPQTQKLIDQKKEEYEDIEITSIGSSLKFCLVAEAKAQYYPRLTPTMEWDTAAAHAILKAVGKTIRNYHTHQSLEYNKENLVNPEFIVE